MSDQHTGKHLTTETLVDYFENKLADSQQAQIEEHVANCQECTILARRVHQISSAVRCWTARNHVAVLEAATAEVNRADENTLQEPTHTSIWPMTVWSDVSAAARDVGKDAERLNTFILHYQKPLRIFLLGQFRQFPDVTKNADELLQRFATDKILAEGWLKKANRQKGRFRNFLKTSLKHYVQDWAKKARLPTIPLEQLAEEGIEPAAPETSNDDFDLTWTQTVLGETLEKMESDCKAPGRDQQRRSQIWELFRMRLLDPIFKQVTPVPYEQLVERLGLKSPNEGTNMLLTAKRMFKRHLKDTIAEYEGSEEAAKTELVALAERISQLAEKA